MIKFSTLIVVMAIVIPCAIAQQTAGVSLAVNNTPATPTPSSTQAPSQTNTPQPTPATTQVQNNTPSEPANTDEKASTPIPANPHDPNAPTVLQNQAPNESELSVANTQLLAKNAKLERQIDTLATQNNVLVQERSGQLFMYGAITLAVGVILGFMLARMIARKDRW